MIDEAMKDEAGSASPGEVEMASPAVRVSTPSRWNIPGDVVHRATQALGDYEREQILWLGRWAAEQNLTVKEVAAALKKPNGDAYSPDSLYQVMTGRRSDQGVSLRPFAESIAALRRRESENESRLATGFIETPMTRRLFRIFGRAFTKNRVAFVLGRSQVGKTTAAIEYQRTHNHGATVLVRMPTRGTLSHFLGELAEIVRVPVHRRGDQLRRRVLDCFDERTLLIVDEAHQALMGRADTSAMALEYVREIHDRRKCGVVLMGTDVLRQGLIHNRVLRQLWLRRSPGSVITLPDSVPAADLAVFAQAFGLEPAPDRDMAVKYLATDAGGEVEKTFKANPAQLQKLITTDDGLGAWVRLLEDARDLAQERSTAIRWSHVLVAWCLAKAAEEGGAL